MKTRLIILVMLIVCFSCGTNNKKLSEAQKEKIKGEVKEVVNIIIKSAEQSNFDMASPIWLDSPDFVYINNGKSSSYKEFVEFSKSHFSKANLKCTIKDENYVFLDHSNIMYTTSCTWTSKFKNGYSILADPWTMSLLIREIGRKWKVTYFSESGVEKSIKDSESSNELNQIELNKQWMGTWKWEGANDTAIFWDNKSYGTGLEGNIKFVTKGQVFMERKEFAGYNKEYDKYILQWMRRSKFRKGYRNMF